MNQEEYDSYVAQQVLGQQQNESQQALYAPQMRQQMAEAQAVLVNQTNPDKVVKQIVLRLQGLKEDADGTLKRWGEPKMNSAGIEWATYILESCINQNIILSHFEEDQIGKMMIQLGEDITDDLTLNWRAFGIRNKTDLDIIEDTILYNVFATFNRALGQNEKNWLGRVSVENISGAGRLPQPKKEGIFSKLRL